MGAVRIVEPALEAPPPSVIVDLAIAALATGNATVSMIRPEVEGHALYVCRNGDTVRTHQFDSECARACIARIAEMAGLDLYAEAATRSGDANVARLRVVLGDHRAEILASITSFGERQMAELRLDSIDGHIANTAPPPPPPADVQDVRVGGAIGAYRLEALLGQGGMGIVYRGTHTHLGRPVAVKVMHPRLADEPRDRQRFVAEARAACRLDHPNIVRVHDFGFLRDGRPFMVMELVRGIDLCEHLERGHARTHRDLLMIAKEIALGLGAMHEGGIVHNDLKPPNVILDVGPEGAIRKLEIIDFGAASLIGAAPPPLVYGTVPYMSPEQVEGYATDGRSDLYALGVVLFEMISGRPPFEGEDHVVMQAHVSCPVPVLTSSRGMVPAAVRHLVGHLLEKNPRARPQNAAALVRDIDAILCHPAWLPR